MRQHRCHFYLCLLLCIGGTLHDACAANLSQTNTLVQHKGPMFAGRPTADLIVQNFMRKFSVPGLSLAISKQDHLVYAAAFGWADSQLTQPLTLNHRMRLASCSKPLTALAVLRLVEEGRLDLDAPVFGPSGLLGTNFGVPRFESKPAKVTVRHLLQHTSGGWGNKEKDPMFDLHDLALDEIIRRTVAERELTKTPGTTYAYSNFGFAVLGKVIEKITGTSYEAAVRDLVLRPCDAPEVRISASRGSRPLPDEPFYFGAGGEKPERLRPEIMQAHGGWIGNPVELLRVLDRVDGNPLVPDILRPESLRLLSREGVPGSGYSLGWSVNSLHNRWHIGSMPGSFAMFCCTAGGFNWVMIMNTRSTNSSFTKEADELVWRILDAVRDWPERSAQ
jgi:CubicO group peptidase (beta-lactamase class C family)